MFGLFSPRCPIGPRERVWVERGIARLVDVIGLERVRRTAVLTLDDLQDVLSAEPVAAADIAKRLAPQIPCSVDGITWLEEPDISGQIAAHYVPGDPPTGVVPQQPNQTPELRTAHVARCLCEHAVATGAVGGPSRLAVDLLAVLTGVGLFPANSTLSSKYTKQTHDGIMESWLYQRQPFMPSRLFGYAFAVRCWLCDETSAPWSSQLRPDAKEPFDLGLKFLKKGRPVLWDDARDALRSFGSPPAIGDVIRNLRHREAAVQINALYDVIEYGLTDDACLQEMAGLVHDHSDEVREELIRTITLLNSGSAELGEVLVILGDDSSPPVRTLASLALGEIDEPPADTVETLRMLTKDAEPSVCAAAAESLLRFPAGIEEERSRLFRVLRQQLARCDYERVDRFVHRLHASVPDPEQLIDQEFSGAEDETWHQLLKESLRSAAEQAEEAPTA